MTATRYATVQLVDLDTDDAHLDALGKALMRDEVRAHGKVLSGEVVKTDDRPVVFVTIEDSDGTPITDSVEVGHPLAGDRTDPDARLIRWEADGVDRVTDPDPVVGEPATDDGKVRGNLPAAQWDHGGPVVFKHGIPDASVYAYGPDDQRVGYLFAVEVDSGEHQVEVVPGTAYLVAEPDDEADL